MNNKEVKEACQKFLEHLQANGVETAFMALSIPHDSLADRRFSLTCNYGLNRFETIGIAYLVINDLVHKTGIKPDLPPAT